MGNLDRSLHVQQILLPARSGQSENKDFISGSASLPRHELAAHVQPSLQKQVPTLNMSRPRTCREVGIESILPSITCCLEACDKSQTLHSELSEHYVVNREPYAALYQQQTPLTTIQGMQ